MLENCHFLLTFACQLTSSVSLTVRRRRSDAVIIKQTAETADQSCELNVHYVRDYSANMDSAPPQRSVGTFLWIRGNFHKIFCVIFFKMLKMFVTLHDVNGHTIQHFIRTYLYTAFIHNLHILLYVQIVCITLHPSSTDWSTVHVPTQINWFSAV